MARGHSKPQHSSAQIADVNSTLEYGHSHRLARQVFVGSLFGIALGLVLLISLDGRAAERRQVWLGGFVVAACLGFIGVAIVRRMQPNKASIVISRDGILNRDVSEEIIPWREIRGVGYESVRGSRDLTSTKVVKLEFSPAFYQKYSRGRWLGTVIGTSGDPSELYISYYHAVPVEEAHDAITRRWQYFKREAGALYSSEDVSAADVSTVPPARTSAIRSASEAGALNALASLIKEQSLGERAATFVALAAIAAALTNGAGLWATGLQVSNRASNAEWQAKMQQFDADMKASDEEQRKSRIKWDAISKCMQDMGTPNEDPKCMDKIK